MPEHYTTTFEYEAHGSGTRRRITPAERRAIYRLIEAYSDAQNVLEGIRNGSTWDSFVKLENWHEITASA